MNIRELKSFTMTDKLLYQNYKNICHYEYLYGKNKIWN